MRSPAPEGCAAIAAAYEGSWLAARMIAEDYGRKKLVRLYAALTDSAGEGWEWRSAAEESAEDLYALYDAAADRSRALVAEILDRGGLDAPSNAELPDGTHANIRRVVLDVIEEYGRHTGHADLLREAVDGRTGEDPPWPR